MLSCHKIRFLFLEIRIETSKGSEVREEVALLFALGGLLVIHGKLLDNFLLLLLVEQIVEPTNIPEFDGLVVRNARQELAVVVQRQALNRKLLVRAHNAQQVIRQDIHSPEGGKSILEGKDRDRRR